MMAPTVVNGHPQFRILGLCSAAMTVSYKSYSPCLIAICSVLLQVACASNAVAPKSPTGESAIGSDVAADSEKTAAKDTTDIVEEDNGDDAKPAAKSSASDSKDKPSSSKAGTAAPVDDSRTTESIRKVIDANRPKFKSCYEVERKKVPDLKGTVVLELTLDADGKIKSAGVDTEDGTIKVKAISDCIVKVAQTLTYPASSKGLDKDFRYEFGFNNH